MSSRQEKEPARREVTELAPNVLRMQLPIRLPGLGHVNCYALIDSEGAAVVDPGLPGPSTWRAIQDRLGQAQLSVKDVHTVIVTHSHPDHFGGAERFARESNARIVAHDTFRFGPMEAAKDDPKGSVEHVGGEGGATPAAQPAEATQNPKPVLPSKGRRFQRTSTPWGGEQPRPPLRTRLKWMALRWMSSGSIIPTITHPVAKGDVLKLAGHDWFIVHTPGHTEDHICLHSPELGLFLAGDHVLPTITPHISGIGIQQDPLLAFYESLDQVAELDHVNQVLPAHGHPFENLAERCVEIKRHHDERLEKLRSISRTLGVPATVEAFSQKLFKPHSWGSMAESETYAHLEHLRIAGLAERSRDRDGKYLYLS